MDKDPELIEVLERAVKETVEAQKQDFAKTKKSGFRKGLDIGLGVIKTMMFAYGVGVTTGAAVLGTAYLINNYEDFIPRNLVDINSEAALSEMMVMDSDAQNVLSQNFNLQANPVFGAEYKIAVLAAWTPDSVADYLQAVRQECGKSDVEWCDDSVKERLLGVYNGYVPSVNLLTWDAPMFEALVKYLAHDSYLQEARANWPELLQDARLGVLQQTLEKQFSEYSASGLNVDMPNIAVEVLDGDTAATYRLSNFDDGVSIIFNKDDFDGIDFDTAVGNTLHEGRHHIQKTLAKALDSDVGMAYLEKNNIVADAVIMKFVFDNRIQYSDKNTNGERSWYGVHPHEADAYYYQARAQKTSQEIIARNNVRNNMAPG